MKKFFSSRRREGSGVDPFKICDVICENPRELFLLFDFRVPEKLFRWLL
jgi:hypothetical protein